jgi:uncharacterized membrane protein YbhN (UPF0104 family)
VLGGGITWLVETGLAAGGRAIVLPPFTLAVALVLIGAILLFMARPVRKVSRGLAKRIDPFYATRVVMLAKASSLSGALVGGGGVGIGAFLLSRSVSPAVGSVTMAFATAVAAAFLVVAGLVAEHWCFIPPDDDDRDGTPALKDAR